MCPIQENRLIFILNILVSPSSYLRHQRIHLRYVTVILKQIRDSFSVDAGRMSLVSVACEVHGTAAFFQQHSKNSAFMIERQSYRGSKFFHTVELLIFGLYFKLIIIAPSSHEKKRSSRSGTSKIGWRIVTEDLTGNLLEYRYAQIRHHLQIMTLSCVVGAIPHVVHD